VAIHELAHQLDFTNGHYKNANGDTNGAGAPIEDAGEDLWSVQFDYTRNPLVEIGKPIPPPVPTGYLYQDYWGVKPVADNFPATTRFGQGLHDGFLRTMFLDRRGFMDDPWAAAGPNEVGWTNTMRTNLLSMQYGKTQAKGRVDH